MASGEPHVMEVDPVEGMSPDDPRFKPTLLQTFMRTKPGLDSMGNDWVGAKMLGRGGQGHAGLWVKVDNQTQKVVERIVIKESHLSRSEWKDPDFWFTMERTPQESYVNSLLQHEPTNVVKIYHSATFPEKRCIRQYIEFCQLGDLWHNLQYPHQRVRRKIPEAYLWCLFEQLLRAAVTMEHPVGALGPPGQWVVHMDLKADNIFLSLPDPDHFPKYPVAKVGDFGAAKLCRPFESQARKFEYITYTPGYLPPEVWWKFQRSRYAPYDRTDIARDYPELSCEVTGAANIWTIGMIMACLMNGQSRPKVLEFPNVHFDNWVPEMDKSYSEDIRRYIYACMQQDARRRPSAELLLSRMPDKQTKLAKTMMDQECMETNYDGRYDLLGNFKDTMFPIGANAPFKTPAIVSEEKKNLPGPDQEYSFVAGAADKFVSNPYTTAGGDQGYSFVPGAPDKMGVAHKTYPVLESLPQIGPLDLGTGIGNAVLEAMDGGIVASHHAAPAALAAPPHPDRPAPAPPVEDPVAEAMAAAEARLSRPFSSDGVGFLHKW